VLGPDMRHCAKTSEPGKHPADHLGGAHHLPSAAHPGECMLVRAPYGFCPGPYPAYASPATFPAMPVARALPNYELPITNHEPPIPNPNAKRRPCGVAVCVQSLVAGAGFEPATFGL